MRSPEVGGWKSKNFYSTQKLAMLFCALLEEEFTKVHNIRSAK